MSACHVTGCAQGGIKVLSCAVSDALSQGDACDQCGELLVRGAVRIAERLACRNC